MALQGVLSSFATAKSAQHLLEKSAKASKSSMQSPYVMYLSPVGRCDLRNKQRQRDGWRCQFLRCFTRTEPKFFLI